MSDGLAIQLLAAFGLDLILGDPPSWPHPVRGIAWLAWRGETMTRRWLPERLAGIVTVAVVLFGTGLAAWGAIRLAAMAHPWCGWLASVLVLYSGIALRDLDRHARKVHDALVASDLVAARQRVGMIVGRETESLDQAGVCRATVESVAENLVDGVSAPLVWAAVGGPVGIALYKAVNTMDSLFGYKNERYRRFGWAPARLDDLANWLPARLTAMLVVVAAWLLRLDWRGAWGIWKRDRRQHASPNSGQTEAAVAGALGIRLGGPSRYFGTVVEKPCLGEARESIGPRHILASIRLLLATSVLCLGGAVALGLAMG